MRKMMLGLALLCLSCGSPDSANEADMSTTSLDPAALTSGTYSFRTSTAGNSCMDVEGGGSSDGTNIFQWQCHGGDPQKFRVESRGASTVRLVNPASGKCLDVAGAGTSDGTNIQLWTCNGSAAQDFELRDAGNGRVVMQNPHSGKCVDVSAANAADRTNIQLWTCNNTTAQTFTPVQASAPRTDVTFFVISDTHCDPTLQYDLHAMARAVNAVASNGSWPSSINGSATGFAGGAIGNPSFVVFTGDLMGWGNSAQEIPTFRHYFEHGASNESINFPSYVGLGNHDLDDTPDRTGARADDARAQAWRYVDGRHAGASAPVKVSEFDGPSHAYSWDVAGVHFVQMHRFPGDTNWGLPTNLGFLKWDLGMHAADGRPVFIFHHYAMDAFGTQDRWWTKAQRDAYRDTIRPYRVSGIFAGHSHAAMQYTWESERVFQVNNAKAEINTGNNDGNGSFAIVHITDQKLDVVTCRWLDDTGRYEFSAPFFSGPARP
jgi:cytolysin (calcineurin-like family phosphatase)